MIAAARLSLQVAVAFLAAVLVLLCVVPADAGHCRVAVKQVALVKQVVAYPQVNYFVGAPVRVESLVQKALRDDPSYAEFQRFRQWQSLQHGSTPLERSTADVPASGLIAAKCATCHSGATPKGGLLLGGGAPLDAETTLKAMRMIQDGKMPPKGGLTPDEAGGLFGELLELSTADE
jgi:hypothetical protein